MLNHIPFTLASPSWYDVPWAPGSPYLTGDISVLPADSPRWTTTIRGPWQIHMPPRPTLPEVGWKVHVSAKPSELESVASVVALWCVRHSVPFKVLRTRGLVHASQVKYADRSQSGKVCTCYPDGESLEHFCSGLAELLQNVDSPPVSGELRVGSSPLWLRHGSFREAWAVSSTGVPFPVYPGTTHPDVEAPRPQNPITTRRGSGGSVGRIAPARFFPSTMSDSSTNQMLAACIRQHGETAHR